MTDTDLTFYGHRTDALDAQRVVNAFKAAALATSRDATFPILNVVRVELQRANDGSTSLHLLSSDRYRAAHVVVTGLWSKPGIRRASTLGGAPDGEPYAVRYIHRDAIAALARWKPSKKSTTWTLTLGEESLSMGTDGVPNAVTVPVLGHPNRNVPSDVYPDLRPLFSGEYTGEAGAPRLNPKYLEDGCKGARLIRDKNAIVDMRFTAPGKPVTMVAETHEGDARWTYIIMPIRVA
jgi:hypothetical protein